MKNILIITILAISFSASAARTYSYREAPTMLAQEIEKELNATKEAFSEVEKPEGPVTVQSWVFSRIRFLIKPYLKFDVLSLFEFKIAPMLEFRWTRKAPIGWDFYKLPVPNDDDEVDNK
ncbi:MAG: hypothetical protein DRQ88_09740 [Epsilonproteobacteria bacterium]|nr:MAG: hypothetical protein DRQ89_12120 [Campylobacterota bacterium]RLA65166.1 MAG: hypothetical protein DRQ88_09740 [Campylobacterota bacterium]